MQNQIEQILINKFIVKEKQNRYLKFLSKENTRRKFTKELYHFSDFNWKLFRKIPGSENERETITSKLKGKKNVSSCYIISDDSKFDGKIFSVEYAITNVVGIEGTILIFGDAEIVYYEGEQRHNRYINA
jgi:hypothetical protein